MWRPLSFHPPPPLVLLWRFVAATGSIWDARKADVISTGDVSGAKNGVLSANIIDGGALIPRWDVQRLERNVCRRNNACRYGRQKCRDKNRSGPKFIHLGRP
jgi:hypothetical protein